MTLYVDSSALIKRYVAESDSDIAQTLLLSDTDWVTANHAYVEISLALERRLGEPERNRAREDFERDWRRLLVVSVDHHLCRRAAQLGSVTGSRTLDALHLAAVERAGGRSIPMVTFDIKMARFARSLGFTVLGI